MPKEPDRIVEYVHIEPEEKWGGVCKRVSGCKVYNNAKTPEEYCPTCVREKRSFSLIDNVHGERPIMKEPLSASKQ